MSLRRNTGQIGTNGHGHRPSLISSLRGMEQQLCWLFVLV